MGRYVQVESKHGRCGRQPRGLRRDANAAAGVAPRADQRAAREGGAGNAAFVHPRGRTVLMVAAFRLRLQQHGQRVEARRVFAVPSWPPATAVLSPLSSASTSPGTSRVFASTCPAPAGSYVNCCNSSAGASSCSASVSCTCRRLRHVSTCPKSPTS